MGWFFKKKKKALDVPVPMRKLDESAFSFDNKGGPPVAPKDLKKAAGFDNPIRAPTKQPTKDEFLTDPFANLPEPKKTRPAARPFVREPQAAVAPTYVEPADEFVFLKVEQYKRILGELDASHESLNHLSNISRKLYQSEFNEERNFARLKNTIRSIHDKFLSVDKTIFKS